MAGLAPDRVRRLVIGNSWCWPVDGDVHFEAFSRLMGGPVGKAAIRRYNAFVNLVVPAGLKRREADGELMTASRRPLATPERRLASYVFPRSILRSREFLAACEAALVRLQDKPALIVWGDADFALRRRERERFERSLPNHRTVVLRGAGHYVWEDARTK